MHDTEPDTFDRKTLAETYAEILNGINVQAVAKSIGDDPVEKDDYYSRYFANSPRMITNRGCIEISNSNIDVIHLVQKG